MEEFTDLDVFTDPEEDEYDQFTSESFLDNLEGGSDRETIPDINEQRSKNDVVQDEVENTQGITEWLISLSDVPKALRISEFGHTYIYGRLLDPDGSPTNKFHGFFKNNLQKNSTWKSLPGVLSDRYSVVSLEKFINTIIKPKFENITEGFISTKESWKLAWLGTIENSQNYKLEYIDRHNSTIIFKNIANKDVNINSLISRFGFIITNTYNGTNKLKVSPIVKTTGIIEGESSLDFIDFFTFCNFTQVISHSSKGSDIEDDLATIKENVSEHMSILKEFTDTNSIKSGISKCFRKPGRSIFESILNGESESINNNLLDVLIAASIAIGKKYSIIEYLAIRSKIEMFLGQVF